MHEIVDKYKVGPYLYITEFDTGADIGGEITVFVERAEESILSRTFYFETDALRHVRAFARKFANDPAYQQACLAGTAHWVRVDEWFFQNECVYSPRFLTLRGARTPQELRAIRLEDEQAQKQIKRLYGIIEHQIDYLEGTKEYQYHLRIEQETPEPSIEKLDPEIERIIQEFNRVSGVTTRFSCQGLRRWINVDAWEYGPIWFPGKHEPLAYIDFAELPEDFGRRLDNCVRSAGVGELRYHRVQASIPEKNEAFIRILQTFLENL